MRIKPSKMFGAWAALAPAIIFIPFLAASSPGVGGTPSREAAIEFTEFTLCELDRETESPRGECFPARVPGDVFTALMEAGRIEDPYRDLNSRKVQWVDERAWLYKTVFEYAPEAGRRTRLLFMGLDYISRIELNGRIIAEHEGMFSRIDLDVTDDLDPSGRQELEVVLFGVPTANNEWLGPVLSSSEFGRKKYLKTQMSFNWDFAPRLKGAGIWDRAYLYQTGPVSIKDVFITTPKQGENHQLKVLVEFNEPVPAGTSLSFTMEGPDGSRDRWSASVEAGARRFGETVLKADPLIWWPWDMGEQHLYRLAVRADVDRHPSDAVTETFGFRDIGWGPNPEAPPGSADWVLFVTGKREFMRGANWVPPEAMYGRMDDSRYETLIGMARDAGINMIRVWGGGNRERRAFYDACDRAGVLVWQEFPFACVYLTGYPWSRHFKDLTRQEVEEMVRQLRNHPSLFMWCGGNEFNVKQNKHVVEIMAEVTEELDPTRRFIPASPYKGDTHNWIVWHMKGNLEDYFMDVSPLPSEFGLQAFPDASTIRKWFSPELTWPVNEVHLHHDLGEKKMAKYVDPLDPGDDLDSWVEASQIIQAHYLQRGIENWRQRKYKTSGTAFWQLNEPWPAICWSVIDYELEPKEAYEVLKNTYNPVLVTARFEDRRWGPGDIFRAEVMVVNDLHNAFPASRVKASLCGEPAGSWPAEVGPDTVVAVGQMDSDIPGDCARPVLRLELASGGKIVSENLYRLWVHDPVPAAKLGSTLERIGKRIMSGAWQPKPKPSP